MRTLRFIVDNVTIKQDPSCDFTGLFPGKNEEVRAEFVLSSEWNNTIKVAAFWSMLDKEYEPCKLVDNSCVIPEEALERAAFKIQLIGKRTRVAYDAPIMIHTNKLTIRQTGGKR